MIMKQKKYISIHEQIRTHIPTAEAAFYLCLKEQTMRSWDCPSNHSAAPIKPIKIGNKLLWSVQEIKKLLGLIE